MMILFIENILFSTVAIGQKCSSTDFLQHIDFRCIEKDNTNSRHEDKSIELRPIYSLELLFWGNNKWHYGSSEEAARSCGKSTFLEFKHPC